MTEPTLWLGVIGCQKLSVSGEATGSTGSIRTDEATDFTDSQFLLIQSELGTTGVGGHLNGALVRQGHGPLFLSGSASDNY